MRSSCCCCSWWPPWHLWAPYSGSFQHLVSFPAPMSHCRATSSCTLPTVDMSNVTVGFLVALQVMLRRCATGKKLVRTSQACAKQFDAGFGQLGQSTNSPCTGVQLARSVFAQCSRPLGGYSRCDLGILAPRPIELLHTRCATAHPVALHSTLYLSCLTNML